MIKQIENDPRIGRFTAWDLVDQGIRAGIDACILKNDYVGVKADDYYNSLKLSDCPKMVDFVVVVDCSCDCYNLYVLEMKSDSYNNQAVEEKFRNAIEKFLSDDFKHIFLNDRYKYKNIGLYLISNKPQAALKYDSYEVYVKIFNKVKTKDTLEKDIYATERIFVFRNRILKIQKELPGRIIVYKTT